MGGSHDDGHHNLSKDVIKRMSMKPIKQWQGTCGNMDSLKTEFKIYPKYSNAMVTYND